MTLDPLEQSRRVGIDVRTEAGYGMTPERGFVQDSGPVLSWLRYSREAVVREFPGFVVGYRQIAWAQNLMDESQGDGERFEYRQFLSAGVLAFDSAAHAREYMDWLPTFALDRADKPARAALVGVGKAAVLWRSSSKGHFLDVALIPRGNLVGEVVTRGFKEDGHRGAIKPLALALADRMADVESRARPYDAAELLAAALPGDAWAALGDDQSPYPELITCEDLEVACFPEDLDGLWEQPPVESASGYFIDARALDSNCEYPVVGTELIAYARESEAADRMGNVVGRWLAREGGEEFSVPGIPGAVGVRTVTPNDWEAPGPIGYTWSVFFTHGSAMARAFVAGGPKDWDADAEDPADWDRNRQWAIDASRAWQDRLDVILR